MIPFVESIVIEIDLEEQRAVIDPPPGLIDDQAEIVSSQGDSSDDDPSEDVPSDEAPSREAPSREPSSGDADA